MCRGASGDNRLSKEDRALSSRLASLRAQALAFSRRPLVREGARDTLPIALGIASWGLVAGVAMAKSGMGVPLALLMSLVTYAGSAQIAALPLIAADAPVWVVWGTTLCVSLRFMAFSFHFRPFFRQLPLGRRIGISFLMGDTNFAVFARRFPETEALPGVAYTDYFLGSAIVSFAFWQVAISTGILLGSGIPASWGLGFAGVMALLALTCTQLRTPSSWAAAAVAACAAVAAYALPMKLNVVVAIAAAVAVGVLSERIAALRGRASP